MRWTTLRVLVLGFALLFTATSPAQPPANGPPQPRLDTIFPLGGKFGTTVEELTISGSDLEDTEALLFSHAGIKAEVIVPPQPKVDPKADPKKDLKKPAMAAPKTLSKFKVKISGDVPVGSYDVRTVNRWGVSNPRTFVVGDLPEVNEKEPNNDVPEAQKIDVNTTINGVISTPTDVDYIVFAGKKDQRIILSCLSTCIDSRLVPMVELYDAKGKRLTFNRNYAYNDALADITLPADGDYYVRLSQYTYVMGGPQYFYRLSISTAPWIDAVFPPMIEAGKTTQVILYGRNLPGGVVEAGMQVDGRPLEKLTVTIDPPADPSALQRLSFPGRVDPKSAALDGFGYHIKGPAGSSNVVLIGLTSSKIHLEREGNDTPETAESIPAPCEVAGRIDKRHDRDWYAFEAKKGEIFSIELWSERLGGQSDFLFSVRNSKAMNNITEQDDTAESLSNAQFFSRTNDPPIYKFTAPEDGKYLIHVTSREANFLFGPRVNYRLRITPEKPDFRLVVMPASDHLPEATALLADAHQYFDVFAFRSDGFTGPIALSAEGLPPGVTCQPQVLGNNLKQGLLVVSASAGAPGGRATITIKGTATIQGQKVVREARGATITWATQPNQNIPAIARLDRNPGIFLSVGDKAPFHVDLEPDKGFVKKDQKLEMPLLLKQGEKLTVPFKVIRSAPDAKQPITLQQIIHQQGIQAFPVVINNGQPLPPVAPDKADGTFVMDVRANAVPGTYTIALRASMPVPFVKDPMTKKSQNVTYAVSTMPITLKVLPPGLGKLTVTGPAGNLKPGSNSEITIKVAREFDYMGEYKVKLVLPANTKGLTADEVTIPSGKDEMKLVLKVAADAPPGGVNNIVVQATGLAEGKVPLISEAKFNTNIEKIAPPKKK